MVLTFLIKIKLLQSGTLNQGNFLSTKYITVKANMIKLHHDKFLVLCTASSG